MSQLLKTMKALAEAEGTPEEVASDWKAYAKALEAENAALRKEVEESKARSMQLLTERVTVDFCVKKVEQAEERGAREALEFVVLELGIFPSHFSENKLNTKEVVADWIGRMQLWRSRREFKEKAQQFKFTDVVKKLGEG